MIAIIIFAFTAIYYYIERKNGEYVTQLIEQSQKEFADTLSLHNLDTPGNIKEYFDKSHNHIIKKNIIKIELKDRVQNTLLDYEEKSLPVHIQSVFYTISFLPDESMNYIMLPINDQNFALIYIKKLNIQHQKFYTLKMVILLPSDTIYMMRKSMKEIIYATSIILFLVILSIFPLIYRQYNELEQEKLMLLQSNYQMIKALGNAIALRDSDTSEHNYRVTYYAIRLAETMKMEAELFPALIKGSILHDIGKIGISDSILLKPDILSDKEYAIMQQHVNLGLKIVASIEWLNDDTSSVIAAHHERLDGSGYPNGLRGGDIPYLARLFAIVDVFDALTSKRPYKDPIPLSESLAVLEKGAGSLFDPEMLHTFISIAPSLYSNVHQFEESSLEKLLLQSIQPYIHYMQNNIYHKV